MKGRDRNRPCWCGSGKKYKHCHLNRERDPGLSIWDARAEAMKLFSTKTCLHPTAGSSTCRGQIVRAHTVRRGADLKAIARDGHVYHPHGGVDTIGRHARGIPAALIGINQASTFWGFCQHHDSTTFAPLEVETLVPTEEQAFLLAYRPLVKELYLKERRLASLEITRKADQGKPLPVQIGIQEYVQDTELGVEAALRDLRMEKSKYDADLLAGDFGAVRFVAIHFSETPDVVCSGVVQPDYSFLGDPIQNLADLNVLAHGVAFSLIATESGGAGVFSWRVEGDAACSALVDSLLALPPADIPSALVRFALSEFENVFFSPTWWEALPASTTNVLLRRFMCGLSFEAEPTPDYLHDDGLRPVTWKVSRIDQKRR